MDTYQRQCRVSDFRQAETIRITRLFINTLSLSRGRLECEQCNEGEQKTSF